MNEWDTNRIEVVALDTETYRGRAFLLSHAGGVFRLSGFGDFVRALLALAKGGPRRFVFYNLEYDASALFKWLPREAIDLLYLERAHALPDGTRLRYLPGKYLRISPKGAKALHCYDLFPFFQTSLDAAGRKYLGRSKRELPKGLIANLSPSNYAKHQAQVDAYAIADAAIAQELADFLTAAIAAAGVQAQHLFSPGYIAKRYLKSRGIKPRALSFEADKFARPAYFGGRIEVAQRGTFEKLFVYDIRSAYPAAIAQLPDFRHCGMEMGGRIDSPYHIAEVFLHMDDRPHAAPIPWRDNGLLIYPRVRGQVATLTNFDLESLDESEYTIRRVLNLYPVAQSELAELVEDLYRRRQESDGASKVYKLILNSLYGIFAEGRTVYESVGPWTAFHKVRDLTKAQLFGQLVTECARLCPESRRYWERLCACEVCRNVRALAYRRRWSRQVQEPLLEHGEKFYRRRKVPGRFRHIILAAMITGHVRRTLYQAIQAAGTGYVASFTDSVLTQSPLPAELLSEGLGGWELEYTGRAIVVGSGVYETDAETKLRGFRWRGSLRDKLDASPSARVLHLEQMDRLSMGRMVRLPLRDVSEFNVLHDTVRKLDLNFDEKRVWPRRIKNARELLTSRQTSAPRIIGG